MRKRILAAAGLWCVLVLPAPALAQPGAGEAGEPFAVTPLVSLLAGEGSAVVRLDERRFDVQGLGRATERVRRVVTVLGAEGRDQGRLVVFYDRLRRLKKLTGVLRDETGRVVRKLQGADEEDYSAISGGSLYEDGRVRVASLFHDRYPYTVEFSYEVDWDGLVHWPTWYPQEQGEAVERGVFEVEAPAGLPVRHRVHHTVQGLDLQPEEVHDGDRQRLRWTVHLLPAFTPEPHGPTAAEQAVAVHTAPERFEIEGTTGDLSSWSSFGRWYAGLAEGRQVLPPEAVAEVRALVAGAPDAREKARRLYQYLQERTRYVSVQLGLGGWQPFDAAYVHQRGYGDCKALTNYMLALLQAAGVPAYPALLRGGEHQREVLAGFPSNQFNHVILAVPLAGDTLWLENTSQTAPFGHLGTFTEDRYALLVKPGGGELVRTPRSTAADNQIVRTGRVAITAEGHAAAEVQTVYTGNEQDQVRLELAQASARDRETWLHDLMSLPNVEVVRADFASLDAREPAFRFPLAVRLPRYAARTGSRLFFRPCLMAPWRYVPPADTARTQPVHAFPYAFLNADTLHYTLPAGFSVEALPAPVAIEAPFGRYEASLALQADGTLAYRRRFEVTETRLPPDQYAAFRDFLRRVFQADKAQVVLVAK